MLKITDQSEATKVLLKLTDLVAIYEDEIEDYLICFIDVLRTSVAAVVAAAALSAALLAAAAASARLSLERYSEDTVGIQ